MVDFFESSNRDFEEPHSTQDAGCQVLTDMEDRVPFASKHDRVGVLLIEDSLFTSITTRNNQNQFSDN